MAVATIRWFLGLGIVLGCAACSSPDDPFTTGPGHASILGSVTTAAGSPVVATTVRMTCPGVSPVLASTDSTGHFGVNLTTTDQALRAGNGKVTCRFTEPANSPVRVQRDVALGFAQGPVLVALQFVNLRRP